MNGNHFTDPKIYGSKIEHEWFIGFTFKCAERLRSKRVQVRLGINYQTTVKARMQESENVLLLTKQCLGEGWNPFDCDLKAYLVAAAETQRKETEKKSVQKNLPSTYGFNAGMDWALSKKSANKDTSISTVETAMNFAKEAATKLGYDNIPIKEITKFHICEILDEMLAARQRYYDQTKHKRYEGKKVTPNLYNSYWERLSGLFFVFENRGLIDVNPCCKIAKRPAINFGVHRHPTVAEIAIIKKELPKLHPELYQVARALHVTGMRPNEILNTRFEMINYLNCVINLSEDPYNDAGELIGKTTVFRQVPVPHFYLKWLKKRSKLFSPTDYIFSRKLRPGPVPITVVWLDQLWDRYVKQKLGINVSIYSFKGLGGDAKRDAGVETVSVSAGYGHTTTTLARKVYLQKEGERLRQQVIDLAPDL